MIDGTTTTKPTKLVGKGVRMDLRKWWEGMNMIKTYYTKFTEK